MNGMSLTSQLALAGKNKLLEFIIGATRATAKQVRR